MRALRATLAFLLVLAPACRREKPPLEIDPSLARLVPAGTVLLAGARMDEIRATPLYARWIARVPAAALDGFARESGLDPRKDVRQLLIASDGNRYAVLARGAFSVPEIERRLLAQGARKVTYKGMTLVTGGPAAVVFLDATTAAAGPEQMLKVVIDQAGHSRSGISQPLREKMQSVPAGSQVWVVTLGSNPALRQAVPETGNLSNLRRVIESVDGMSLGMNFQTGLRLDAAGAYRTEQEAKLIHDALRGLLGMGRLSTPDNQPELLLFYDAIRVSQDQTLVRVQADVSMDVLDRVLAKIGGLNHSPRR